MNNPRLGLAVLLVALIVAAPSSNAQDRSAAAGAVEPFGWLVGRWEGAAWIDLGPRGQQTLTQREYVSTAARGTIINISGQGTMRLPDGSDRIAFDAFATIHPGRDGTVAMRAYRMDGAFVDPELRPEDGGFAWSMTDPRAGRIRYTVRRTPAGEWHEIGERSSDGQQWTRFFEMTLQRVAE